MPSNVDDFESDEVLKMAAFDGKVECEAPNNILDKFTGTLILRNRFDKNQMRYPISNDNVLLRGTTLRNVNWAFGLVVFAGPDTKLMQNTGRTHFKVGIFIRAVSCEIKSANAVPFNHTV